MCENNQTRTSSGLVWIPIARAARTTPAGPRPALAPGPPDKTGRRARAGHGGRIQSRLPIHLIFDPAARCSAAVSWRQNCQRLSARAEGRWRQNRRGALAGPPVRRSNRKPVLSCVPCPAAWSTSFRFGAKNSNGLLQHMVPRGVADRPGPAGVSVHHQRRRRLFRRVRAS